MPGNTIATSASFAELYQRRSEEDFTGEQQVTLDIRPTSQVDLERVVFHTGRIRGCQAIPGIVHSTFSEEALPNEKQKPEDEELRIAGVSLGTTATATAAFGLPWRRRKSSAPDPLYSDVWDANTPPFAQQIRATHPLDRAIFTRNVIDRQRWCSREEAWANELDNYVTTSLLRAARYNLLERTGTTGWIYGPLESSLAI